MNASAAEHIAAAQVVVPSPDLAATLAFFTDVLGFRVESIFPADRPTVAVITGYGTRLRLDGAVTGTPPDLRLECHEPDAVAGGVRTLTAPNGSVVHLVPAVRPLVIPPEQQSFVLTRVADVPWGSGRAGMRYRDLIPDRQGGRFIASHIHIPTAGPVPDYVHFHKVRFQMIFCHRGWVRLVYEDQGDPFVLEAGDCVLQPPEIRHRVLESGGDLQVVEIGCPAVHETFADPATRLPTGVLAPERDFGGQRFVRHVAATAPWAPWRFPGYECRTIGFGAATDGLAEARVARPVNGADDSDTSTPTTARGVSLVAHHGEFAFAFVLTGTITLVRDGADGVRLGEADCVVIPAGVPHAFVEPSADLELLDVTLPASLPLASP
jgi:mannose-6-phosphate isomerase-like protein (cupin superfamily)